MQRILNRLIDKRPCPNCGVILTIPGSTCACSYGETECAHQKHYGSGYNRGYHSGYIGDFPSSPRYR